MSVSELRPPEAPERPHVLSRHGDERPDPWYWLREKDDPAVLEYLRQENEYADAAMAPTQELQDRLYAEMLSRIQEDDTSAPVRQGAWEYYRRTQEGCQYPLHCRRPAGGGEEQVLLDGNALAAGHEYFNIGDLEPSPDHRLVAYTIDLRGDEVYTLRVLDTGTGQLLPDEVPGVYYSLAWGSDNRTLFYTTVDETLRPWRVVRHVLGAPNSDDAVVWEEADASMFVSVTRLRSGRYIRAHAESYTTTETRILDADQPTGALRVLEPRERGVRYWVDHHPEHGFLIRTDRGAPEMRVVRAGEDAPGHEHWVDVVPARDDVKVDGIDVFAGHLVVYERSAAGTPILVHDLRSGEQHQVQFDEVAYSVSAGANPEFETTTLRFMYMSLVTPPTDYDYDMDSRELEVRKRQPVPGGYDPDAYVGQRLYATAEDGVQVPISVVYRRDLQGAGRPAPCLLYGYGSYGISLDPWFSSVRLSLLDRGFVYAIAHIRGGGDLGEHWRMGGRMSRKRTTFTDFIACAEHLVSTGRTTPELLAANGGSAGGLLMGAVANMRPDLFRAIVAEVPFVDVVTTILDPSLPLSVIEHEEWGNPEDPDVYAYMKSYSPYDNVREQRYPSILVTAGLNDPRVSYWEPAKWVARLRATAEPGPRLLLRTNMGAGHGGASGRYDHLREVAFNYAFVLDALGLADTPT